jgi:hypothetical protein
MPARCEQPMRVLNDGLCCRSSCRMRRLYIDEVYACFVKVDAGLHDVVEGKGAPRRPGRRVCQQPGTCQHMGMLLGS